MKLEAASDIPAIDCDHVLKFWFHECDMKSSAILASELYLNCYQCFDGGNGY